MQSDFTFPDAPLTSDALEELLKRLPPYRLPLTVSTEAVHDLIRRMHDESVLLPAYTVELIVACGLLRPEALPALKVVQLAPGIVVNADADHLGWDETACKLLYRTSTGGWRRLDRVFRWLSFGDDYGDAWSLKDPSAFPDPGGDVLTRVSLELDTTIEIVPLAGANGAPSWTAKDAHGRWQLVDRWNAGRQAVFGSSRDAALAADAALAPAHLAGLQPSIDAAKDGYDRFAWIDRLDAPAWLVDAVDQPNQPA